jgi:AAA family ATP:ADP antiporter
LSIQEKSFSKLRLALWPIHNSELKKFIPMSIMMFLVLVNYTLLRNTKDTLLITAPSCGVEVIPFLKMWGVMPCAILFFLAYTKLSNILSREALFYTCLIPFLVFFAAFSFIIYPNKEWLHPTLESISILRENCPNVKWFISLYGVWSFAIFYVLSELWGVIVVSLLFWQFANEITRTIEAKRFYAFFGLLGNISLILSGAFVQWLGERNNSLNLEEAWGLSITYMMIAVVAAGILILVVYWWMNRYVLTDPIYYDAAKETTKLNKPKLSLGQSLSYLFSSKYLGFITILVLSYGITSNIIDLTWKNQIKTYLPHSNDYFAFMGRYTFWTGVVTVSFILSTKGIVNRFGWYWGAIITPLILFITGALFFSFVLFKDHLNSIVSFFGVTSVYMAVMIGAVQNILSKGAKYSLFDPTKEMAYIPLDQELKVKGKAAVDVIGGRLGKTGGGLIEFILLTVTGGSQLTIAPYLFGIIAFVSLIWMGAVKNLSKLYNAKVREKGK